MENLEGEEWKSIPEYEGFYEASSHGRIRSLTRHFKDTMGRFRPLYGRILKQMISDRGYHQVNIYRNKKMITRRVNRLVALTFIPNPENKPEVNHKDGIKANNAVDNLEWSTSSENTIHAFKNGLKRGLRGHLCPTSKLTEVQVFAIRASELPLRDLAGKYGVSTSNIRKIKSGETWKV